jgi:hypothetical protein
MRLVDFGEMIATHGVLMMRVLRPRRVRASEWSDWHERHGR